MYHTKLAVRFLRLQTLSFVIGSQDLKWNLGSSKKFEFEKGPTKLEVKFLKFITLKYLS